jgi:hypothetical protein
MADKKQKTESLSADTSQKNETIVADSSPEANVNTADTLPDNDLIEADILVQNCVTEADNPPDNETSVADSSPDSTVGDSQNVDNFSKIPISDFLKKYGIGRDPLYGRMRYLQITTYKIKNKAYLDAGQAAYMDALHEHIKATGRMDGYPIPEPSGPRKEETEQADTQAVSESSQLQQEEQEQTAAITVSQTQQLTAAPELTVKERQHETLQMNSLASQVMQNAQNKAAGVLIAENMLAQQFIENPEMLPEELRVKIKESAQVPEVDPFAYANALIDFAKKPGVVAA